MNSFDCASETSETFFFWSSAYNPASFKNICGRATCIPVGEVDDRTVPTLTPATSVLALSESVLRSAEISLILLNLGAESVKLTMMISSIFKDLNVLPAHVNWDTPPEAALILTSSPSPNSSITFGIITKSPEKSAPDINVSSWWTAFTSSRPNFWTVVIDLVNELSPFILTCSPSINVPDTWSNDFVTPPPPADTANPVAPLLNPSIKLPIGNSELDNATLNVNFV